MEGAEDKVRGMRRTERKGKIEGGVGKEQRERVGVGEEGRDRRRGKRRRRTEVVWEEGRGRRERKGSGMR